MTSFASTADLASFLNRTIAVGAETTRAQLMLDLATAAIQNWCRQTISSAETTALLPGTWSQDLELPERPVTEVDTVEVDGVATTDWDWNERGVLRRGAASFAQTSVVNAAGDADSTTQGAAGSAQHWGGPQATVSVTYTHGFATIPADIKAVCLAVAGRAFTSEVGVKQESLGAYSVTYGGGGADGVTITPADMTLLRRYRR